MMQTNKTYRVLMLLENESVPDDCRVLLEAEALVDTGFAVTIICPTGECHRKVDRIGEVQVYRYPKPWELGGFVGYLFEYAYSLTITFVYSWFVLLRHGFDVVHVHTPPDMTALIAIFYKLFGKRFVFDHHDLSPELYQAQHGGDGNRWVHRVLLWFERLACRHADRLIATNETQRRVQQERCGATPEHCHVVRNGPNELFLADVEPLQRLQRADQSIIGYVGVIGIQDGVDGMVRALQILKSERNRADFLGVIVGDGPALTDLKQLTEALGLSEQILFTGMIPFSDVPRHIASFDICLTPDPSNPYNDSCTTIKTMEYMALGKPTVCFKTHENQITAGDSALYASNNSLDELAAAIERLMDDPSRRETMGKLARSRIEDGLTWQHQATRLQALYRELFQLPAPGESIKEVQPSVDSPESLNPQELAAR